ncbi:ATP-binding protein [Paenibacillus sp. KS-LC4]|uniref:ATP-binding protein n=1 Tax=Paenibacillus sp. KS-LC4 TaxID=2979727 RepID=UPI0030CB8102
MYSLFRNEKIQMVGIALATAVGAEFRITPFSGDFYRIGLGVSIFLFFLLQFRHLSFVKTGFLAGIAAVIFQSVEWLIYTNSTSLIAGLQNNAPAALYYTFFAWCLSKLLGRAKEIQPLALGALVTIVDFSSNLLELLFRNIFLGTAPYHFDELALLLMTAVIRSYFVIGLYNSMAIQQFKMLHFEQEKRIEQMLNVGSSLYGEAFYLRKSMDNIEGITASSYELYDKLRQEQPVLAKQALIVTQQIHEVKKDTQRILAGLLKLFDHETLTQMSLVEVMHYVRKGTMEYSEMLGKKIAFQQRVAVDLITPHYIALLSILNNLAANAVEAIESSGSIDIEISQHGDKLMLIVADSGKGIPPEEMELVFEPGFTTKFDQTGIAATGIGLSHVRDIISSFAGSIRAKSLDDGPGTAFIVELSLAALNHPYTTPNLKEAHHVH